MTDDKELIARLRDWEEHDEGKNNDARDAAADRIEALEAKLAKAVELALEECPFRHGTPKYNDWWHHRRTTLAEIKGESHD